MLFDPPLRQANAQHLLRSLHTHISSIASPPSCTSAGAACNLLVEDLFLYLLHLQAPVTMKAKVSRDTADPCYLYVCFTCRPWQH
jgi:hypothetical protein